MIAEGVIFGSGRPAVLVPGSIEPGPIDHVVIAWDGSRVAARAVADAQFIMQRAARISIVTILGEKRIEDARIGERLADSLRRRGLAAQSGTIEAEDGPDRRDIAEACARDRRRIAGDGRLRPFPESAISCWAVRPRALSASCACRSCCRTDRNVRGVRAGNDGSEDDPAGEGAGLRDPLVATRTAADQWLEACLCPGLAARASAGRRAGSAPDWTAGEHRSEQRTGAEGSSVEIPVMADRPRIAPSPGRSACSFGRTFDGASRTALGPAKSPCSLPRSGAKRSPQPPALMRGLAEAEARARLEVEGYNELPRSDRRTPLRIVVEVMREPMLALLLGGGARLPAARRPARRR